MLKSTIIASLMALGLLTATAYAQSDLHFSAGLRYQLSSWQVQDVYYYNSQEAAQNYDSTELGSEFGHLYGPIVSLSIQKFSFSVNYMMGSWEFPKQFVDLVFDTDDGTLTAKRSELIITASYQIIPRLMLFLGFKNLTLKEEFEFANYPEYNYDTENKGSGYGGGISGSYPFSPAIHGYGTLGYLSIGGDFDGWGNLIFEGGVRLFIKNVPVFGAVGYRYESFTGSGTMNDAVLHGPILTVAFYK